MDINYFVAGVLFVIVVFLLLKITKLQEDIKGMKLQIKGMKYTLDQVGDQMELPENPINDKLRDLLEEGKDIQAVKLAREALGLSLLEGKQYVDALNFDD